MKPRSEDRASPVGHGSVRSDELYTLREIGRRLGLGPRALCDAQRRGLRTILFGRLKLVLGDDVVSWARRLAEGQTQDGGARE